MKHYDPTSATPSTEIQFNIPLDILKDLAIRAEENGHSIELEMSIRLARTLEHDLEMIAEDNEFAMLAFDECQRRAKENGKQGN